MRQRLRTIIALGLVALLAAGCSTAQVGRAVPDGEDVAEYVRKKFTSVLDKLGNGLQSDEPHKSRRHSFVRIDEKKANIVSTAVQLGDPPSRLHKNHSNKDSNDYRDYFHPADSDVEYILLGPVYEELAPTPWVSMPYDDAGLDICFWSGYSTVCKMLSAISRSLQNGHPDKQATSLENGSVELKTSVSLRTFVDERVAILPPWAEDRLSEAMLNKMIKTRLVLGPEGELKEIEMNGLITGEEHEIEIKEHYRVLPPPTERALPKVPPADQVTKLTTDEEIDDFYARMQDITAGSG